MASPVETHERTPDRTAERENTSAAIGGEEVVSTTEARQGRSGRPVLIVLLAGILLALIFWIPAEWWGNSIAPEHPANEPPATTGPSPAENNPQPAPSSQP